MPLRRGTINRLKTPSAFPPAYNDLTPKHNADQHHCNAAHNKLVSAYHNRIFIFGIFFHQYGGKPSATAEKSTKQSPVKFMVKSKPFKFTKMIPAKPEIQPMIFPGVNFSC